MTMSDRRGVYFGPCAISSLHLSPPEPIDGLDTPHICRLGRLDPL